MEAEDRDGLEQLCRYGLRAPFALDRFSLDPDGCVRYQLTKPWPTPTGKTELHFEPLALLRRRAALIPAPYLNLVRYYGVFANTTGAAVDRRSRYRTLLPPPPPPPTPQSAPAPPTPIPPLPDIRPRRLGWAQLLRRVINVDALTCAKCMVPMVVVAFLSDPKVVTRILDHLDLPSQPPPLAASWMQAAEELYNDVPACDEGEPVAVWDESDTGPHDARGPPLLLCEAAPSLRSTRSR
ncbi:MAG: transposase [Deltaproteobacteria bacterium]|nr:transposase [Deltaproteobacteria bacterium]